MKPDLRLHDYIVARDEDHPISQTRCAICEHWQSRDKTYAFGKCTNPDLRRGELNTLRNYSCSTGFTLKAAKPSKEIHHGKKAAE